MTIPAVEMQMVKVLAGEVMAKDGTEVKEEVMAREVEVTMKGETEVMMMAFGERIVVAEVILV